MRSGYWSHATRRGLNRRRLLVGAAASAGAFALACSGDDDSGSGSGSSGATSGNNVVASAEEALPGQLTEAEKAQATSIEKEYRLRYNYSKFKNLPGQKQGPKHGGIFNETKGPPRNWDILDPGLDESTTGVVYSGLIDMPITDFDDVHRGIRPTGDLAESWEQPDPTVIVFTLNQGVKFQDRPPLNGRLLTSDDVRGAYEALRKAPYQAPNYADVKSIEAVDDRRVRFTFNRPAPYFLNNLLSQKHSVMPPELLGTERSKTEAVGTGPMILKAWEAGRTVDWERNPTYFKKDKRTGMQLPYFDGMHGQVYGDRNSQLAAWRNGQIDQILFGYGLSEPKSVNAFDDPNTVFQVVSPSTWGMTHVAFKLEKPPWNDVRVRRALSLALNRKEMVDGLCEGLAAEGSYPLDWTFFKDAKTGEFQEWPWAPEQLGQYQKYDANQAKQLLTAAGFSAQNPLNFEATGIVAADPGGYLLRHVTHLAILDQWKQTFGDMIKPTFTALESVAYSQAGLSRNYPDVFLAWLTGPAYEPDGFLYAQLNSKSSYNVYGVNDAEIDQATEAQRSVMEQEKRQPLWQKTMDRDLDQVYRIFTYHGYKTQGRRANLYNVLDAMHAWTPGFRAPAQWGWKLS
jgi:peptide/nickel transport system substrate-binding protein